MDTPTHRYMSWWINIYHSTIPTFLSPAHPFDLEHTRKEKKTIISMISPYSQISSIDLNKTKITKKNYKERKKP